MTVIISNIDLCQITLTSLSHFVTISGISALFSYGYGQGDAGDQLTHIRWRTKSGLLIVYF